ncbi:PKD domain-containing protein [Paenibacillus aestuarii]|uniref:PKD domain-containing protein n=1 Tax=Paenibacillus aestuarii TaxID=516965 RepID=A0ABW0K6Q9_9BACL
MKRKLIRAISIGLLCAQLASIALQVSPEAASATVTSTKTVSIDFGAGSGNPLYDASSFKSVTVPLNSGGQNVLNWSVSINGSNVGQAGSYNAGTDSITMSSVFGNAVNVYGTQFTNPGHHFNRIGTSTSWQHQGENTDNLQYNSGSSSYPGPIPDAAYDVTTKQNVLHSQMAMYELWAPGGLAVTHAYHVPPPNLFNTGSDMAGITIPSSNVQQSSIKITGATDATDINDTGATALSFGSDGKGGGDIRLQMAVDSSKRSSGPQGSVCTTNGLDFIDTPLGGGAIDRNYCMAVNTTWEGLTYVYQGTITINYGTTSTPDLGNIVATPPACVDTSQPYTYNFTFNNSGTDINTAFNVTIAVDGTVFKTLNYSNALSGVPKTGSFSYQFSSTTSKTFTITLDPGNTVVDTNTGNNVVQLPVTPVASCSSGGGGAGPEVITGTLSVELPTVSYGSTDIIQLSNVSVSGGNNCALKTGDLVYTQGSYSKSYRLNYTGKFSHNFIASPYNGFGQGPVSVVYKVVTTCGTTKDIGPGNFTVTIKPDLGSPQFQASWFDVPYYSGYDTPVTRVPIGETISLGPIKKPAIPANSDPGTPYDPNGDPIIYTWDFAGSTDPWIQNLGDTTTGYGFDPHADHFNNIKADTKGSHAVKVSAIDTEGASAGPYNVTVDIVDPNPVPIISLPPKVIERRPFTPDISCSDSYSPYRARSIANCDWHGTKLSKYMTAGTYDIQLDVTDSAGMVSLNTAHANLVVQPDLPPVAEAALPSKGLRGTAMIMQDKSYSPDNDVIVKHTDTIMCDTNFDGSFTGQVLSVTPDASGNITFMPTVLTSCKLRIYVEEDWGNNTTKDFPFTIVNQQPSVAIDVKGDQPSMPVLNATNYDITTLLADRSRFNVSDYYNASRYSGLRYDATEQALAAPDRSNAVYLGMSANAPTKTNPSIASTTNHLSLQATANLWYDESDGYYCGSYIYCVPYGLGFKVINTTTNSMQGINKTSTSYQADHAEVQVNGAADMVWVRWTKTYLSGSFSGYRDELYKLSAIANGSTTPYKTIPFTPTSVHPPFQYANWEVADNPPPAEWTPVGTVSSVGNVPYTVSLSGYLNGTSVNEDIFPKYTDKAGNFYALSCYTQRVGYDDTTDSGKTITSYYTRYDCNIQKISQSGVVLWTNPDNITNVYTYSMYGNGGYVGWFTSPKARLNYVTDDNSMLYVSAANQSGYYGGTQYSPRVIDNNTGASRGTTFEVDSTKVYADWTYMPYSVTYSYGCHDDICYANATHFKLYNLKTGQTTLDTATLPGSIPSQDIFSPYNANISSDGKAILPVNQVVNSSYVRKLLIIDIVTGSYQFVDGYDYVTGQIRFIPNSDGAGIMEADTGYSPSYYNYQGYSTGIPISMPAGNFSNGVIVDNNTDFWNGSIYVSAKYINYNSSETTGVGIVFRQQDNQNYYQASLTTKGVVLFKVSGGTRTILDKQNNPLILGRYNDLKVSLSGTHIKVYVNAVPLIDLYDGTYTHGKQGIFADAPNVYLKKYHIETGPAGNGSVDNYAIVDMPINYSVKFTDPENDPAIPQLGKWTFTNNKPQKFLNAGDGKSDPVGTNSYNNYTVNSPIATIGKVGEYSISFTEPDDPAPPGKRYPDNTYASFRQYADPDTKIVIVHRRPIACFTISQLANYTMSWNDCSYDPDRWLSPTNYSTENSSYAIDHGIKGSTYSYTDPDGNVFNSQLLRPSKQGTYTVRKAVVDEYGAWSDWFEQTIYVDVMPVNNPPSVYLTFPSGSQSSPSYVSSLTPTITWNQADPDAGTVFGQARIVVKNESGNTVIDRTVAQNTTSLTGQWQLDTALNIGVKYQVQVMVSDDGGLWSPLSNVGWIITNRPPAAYMSFPWGTQASPTAISTLKPTFTWSQSDPDPGDGITAYQIQVWDSSNATKLYDSGQVSEGFSTAGSWSHTPGSNLNIQPHQPVRVRVQVWDSRNTASGFSPDAWMVLNRQPVANFDWSPKPAFEGDWITLTNQSTDPDGDTLQYLWSILAPDGTTSTATSQNALIPYSKIGTYKVTLTATDNYGVSDSITKNVVVNDLTVTGQVSHTTEWNNNRINYNINNSGTNDSPRPYNVFWAGEKFVLSSSVTNTGTLTEATDVKVTLLQRSITVSLSSVDKINWSGSMWQDDFDTLTDGTYTFRFTGTWNNGHTESSDVQVEIRGSVWDVTKTHRKM